MYIQAMRIRGDLMTTKARAARWHKMQDITCDACGRRETLGHILQVCPRSWGARINRHDRVVDLVRKQLEKKGHTTLAEPIIKTTKGVRKPDLVATKDGVSWVIDGMVTSDVADLDAQVDAKANYYDDPEVTAGIKALTESHDVRYSGVILNWRGALAPKTTKMLWDLGVPAGGIKLLVVRCLEGSVHTWQQWRRSTYSRIALDDT